MAWGEAPEAYPDESLTGLFEAQVARTPDAVAVVGDDRTLTSAELNQEANRLARHLRALGVGTDARVGLCLERTADVAVAVLGVLKAGAAYVPLDPDYPPARLSFMFADSAAEVLLTHRRSADRLPDRLPRTVYLDADRPEIAEHDAADLGITPHPEGLGYVIYTSGSTGTPKRGRSAATGPW